MAQIAKTLAGKDKTEPLRYRFKSSQITKVFYEYFDTSGVAGKPQRQLRCFNRVRAEDSGPFGVTPIQSVRRSGLRVHGHDRLGRDNCLVCSASRYVNNPASSFRVTLLDRISNGGVLNV